MSDNIICSFCGKASTEVRKLIRSNTACICNECTELHINTLAKENNLRVQVLSNPDCSIIPYDPSQNFVPSFSLIFYIITYIVTYEIGGIEDDFGNEITLETLSEEFGHLAAHEKRELQLNNELASIQNITDETISIQMLHQAVKLADEMARIPYEMELILEGRLRNDDLKRIS